MNLLFLQNPVANKKLHQTITRPNTAFRPELFNGTKGKTGNIMKMMQLFCGARHVAAVIMLYKRYEMQVRGTGRQRKLR